MTATEPFASRDTLADPIEETKAFAPKFGPDGLIPAIVTDAATNALLMMAWMNETALATTIRSGEAHYWSRSRSALWRKGETSGNTQSVVEIRTDCDQDVVQLVVNQRGPACHTDRPSCFYRMLDGDGKTLRPTAEASGG